MIINFKKVNITNFMSFKDTSLDLNNTGYNLIQGVNENPLDLATSNGSGKSSIWESLVWCLTGNTIRGCKNVANINVEGTTSVELIFTVDNVDYRVIRTKNPSNLQIFVDNVDKSGKGIRDTEEILKQYLPDFTAELIGSVIILGQGLPQKFTGNSPSGRKDMLERLSKSEFMLEDIKCRVADRITVLHDQLNTCNIDATTAETAVNICTSKLNEYKNNLSNLKDESEYETQLQNSDAKLSDLNMLLNSTEEKIKFNQEEATQITDKISKFESDYYNSRNDVNVKYSDDIIECKSRKSELEAQITEQSKSLKKLKSITDICPTCGQKLVGVEKPDTSDLELEIQQNKLKLSKLDDELKSLEKCKDEELYKLTVDYRLTSEDYVEQKSKLMNYISELNDRLSETKLNIKSETEINTQLKTSVSELSTKKDFYNSEITNLATQIAELTKKIDEVTSRKQNLDEHLAVVSKMESYIKRDFRGYLLKNVIDYINGRCAKYSVQVFNSELISFGLDGNNISITYDGKEYETLSGGERVRIDIIVQLALRDMLCEFLGFSTNIIVLDEIFDSLDFVGCEKILNLLFTNLTDINCIYIITHRADLPISCDRVIQVRKNNQGISYINAF